MGKGFRIMYKQNLKRLLDLAISACALGVLWPLFGVLSLWIRLDSPGPVLFRQKRFARDEAYFEILKFRTMRTDTPKDMPTHLLDNPDQFITRSGRFLRKTSLDELPQLINIFKGEMSFIGPRPALWNQEDLMALRKENGSSHCRPGLSGWAQIHGRDELCIEDKAALDGYYADHIGFRLDLICFFGTFLSVFRQEGIVEGRQNANPSGSAASLQGSRISQ